MTRSLTLLALSVLAALAGRASARETSGPAVLEFRTLMRGSQGVVRCGLFTEKHWLKTPTQTKVAAIRDGVALCAFNDVPPGVYGISAFHDENGNGKLDTNFIGLPTEDYCASRDARNHFGPPSFVDAKFSYTGGLKQLSARMK